MANVNDQTTQLYDAMSKLLPSILEDPASLGHNKKSRSHDPNRIIASSEDGHRREHVRRLIQAGMDLYTNGNLGEAAECYRKALTFRSYKMAAWYGLGVIDGHLKRYEESKQSFRSLLRLLEKLGNQVDPTLLASAHQGIGAALLGLWTTIGPDEPPLAVVEEGALEFRSAVRLDPKSVGAWLGLGITLHIQERLDDAEEAFRKALEIEPDSQVAADHLRAVLEDKLEKRLFDLGYLSRINKPIRDFARYENRTPIRVEGKPLSEIIVEERR